MKTVLIRRLAATAALAAAGACGGGDGGVAVVTVASVVITAPAAAPVFGALGRTVTFTAEARDGSGAPISGRVVSWSSSAAGVATISSAGVVTAVGNGTTQIRATVEGVQSAVVLVTVQQVTHSVVITPTAVNFGARGSTRLLAAEARDSTANPIPGRPVAWSGGAAGIATVSAGGLVTSVDNGTTGATATIDGIEATITITVNVVVAAVVISPGAASFATLTRTQQFAAEARDSNANAIGSAVFTWSSTNEAAVTVDGNGLATVAGQGVAEIRATTGSIFGSATVTVNLIVVTISVQPIATFTRIGQQRTVGATTEDSLGNPISGATLAWTSSDPDIVSIDATTGVATSVADGSVTITASQGSVEGTADATVAAVAHSVAVTPAIIEFGALNSTRQLAATVQDSGGTAIPGRVVTFALAGTGAAASVSPAGLVTALAPGDGDTAVAAYNGADASLTTRVPVNVTQVPFSVTLSGPTVAGPDTMFASGRMIQYTAAAADSNGNAIPGADFTWTSTVPGVAAVDVTGMVTAGMTDGSTQVQAAAASASAARTVVLRRFAETFLLSPTSASISTDDGTQVFNATVQDSNGTNLPISWVSRNTTLLTLSATSGTSVTATAVNNGSTYVVMSGGTRSDSALVTLTNQLNVSFSTQVQPIFTTSCARAGCHTTPSPQENMNLSAGNAYAAIVNVPSNQVALMRVLPGDPDNSYLVQKIQGGAGITRMPADGPPFLTAGQIQLIRDWIAAGAQNN
jgi:uncharacterized protein YjdB